MMRLVKRGTTDIVERHVQRRYGDAIKGNEFLTVATGRDDDARVWSEGKV
jgi:hypothetical protein